MSKKILTLLLSFAILSTTACIGIGDSADQEQPITPQFPTKGQLSGTIEDQLTHIQQKININIIDAVGEFIISNGDSFKGKFDVNKIVKSTDKIQDSICLSGTVANGDIVELHSCVFAKGFLENKNILAFHAYVTSYASNKQKLKDYILLATPR